MTSKWEFPELRAVIQARGLPAPPERTDTADEAEKENAAAPMEFHTPSLVESKVPWRVEQQLRWSTCVFIEDMAALLGIPDAPAVTAQLFVQKFYMLHSFAIHDRFMVATAALFLAGKAEEFPIKVRLMTECAMFLLLCPAKAQEQLTTQRAHHKTNRLARSVTPSPKDGTPKVRRDAQGKPVEMSASLGNDPKAANAKHLGFMNALLEIVDVGEVEIKSKKVLLLERVLLQTLSFELGSPQPFAYVAPLMDTIFALEAMHKDASYRDVRGFVFLLLGDAIKSGLCLAYNAAELAAGAVYLGCLYRRQVSANVTTEQDEPWWTVLGLPRKQLKEVARGFLWIYEDESSAKLEALSPGMKELWTRYRPEENMPDLDVVKKLDAELQQQQSPTPQPQPR